MRSNHYGNVVTPIIIVYTAYAGTFKLCGFTIDSAPIQQKNVQLKRDDLLEMH